MPSYFDPGPLWLQVTAAAPIAGLAIINPNSGPGSAADAAYAATVKRGQAAGQRIVAYVYTSYGGRSPAAVKTDIDAYYSWYGVDGIFFDEASTSCTNQPYYAGLNAYVKAKGGRGLTVLNPGMQTAECYMTAADVIVTFEDSYAHYTRGYTAPSWVNKYDPSRFWHIVYGAANTQAMQNAIQLSRQRHAGWVYITNDALPNPYDTLPQRYWADELKALQ